MPLKPCFIMNEGQSAPGLSRRVSDGKGGDRPVPPAVVFDMDGAFAAEPDRLIAVGTTKEQFKRLRPFLAAAIDASWGWDMGDVAGLAVAQDVDDDDLRVLNEAIGALYPGHVATRAS